MSGKSSNIKYLNMGFDEKMIRFLEENQRNDRKKLIDYKDFIKEAIKRNIPCQRIGLVLNFAPSGVARYVQKLRFLGEL